MRPNDSATFTRSSARRAPASVCARPPGRSAKRSSGSWGSLARWGPRPSAATLDRVGETLQAAGSDEEAALLVRTGRLDRERRAASLTGGAMPTPSRAATKPAKDRARELKEVRAALEELRRREKRTRTAQEKALQRRADVESELEDARAAVTESENELTSIEGEIADRSGSLGVWRASALSPPAASRRRGGRSRRRGPGCRVQLEVNDGVRKRGHHSYLT